MDESVPLLANKGDFAPRCYHGSKTMFLSSRRTHAKISVVIILLLILFLRTSSTYLTYGPNGPDRSVPKPFPHKVSSPMEQWPARKTAPQNVAAIIEDRPLVELAPLLLHFSAVLGPTWPVILFTTVERRAKEQGVNMSAPLRNALAEGRISVWYLPSDVDLKKRSDKSDVLTRPWVWEQLAPAGHVLLFDAESSIRSNSTLLVDDFLQYDFVGSPSGGKKEGYDWGLSLWNRSMVLDIVSGASRYSERVGAGDLRVQDEGQWLLKKMKEVFNADGQPAARLPAPEFAGEFAAGNLWYDKSADEDAAE